MKISLAQTQIVWEDKQKNIANAESLVSNLKNAEVVLFPEMSFTGFSMNTESTKESDGYTIGEMKRLAVSYRLSIGFGWVKDCGEKCENHYSIVDASGQMVCDYTKIHPFSYSGEDRYFRGGEEIVTFDMLGSPFSVFICYDLRFPELFRAIANEVHAVIIPANWPATRAEHWKTLLRARAIENQVTIFAINCYGNMGGQYYSGDSCVINPNGDILEMLSDREGVIIFDFIDRVEEYRASFPVLWDRRELIKAGTKG